jgi:hypothetical protein
MIGRTGKQIRDRYINALDPNINHKEWTNEEDQIVLIIFIFYLLDSIKIYDCWVQMEHNWRKSDRET